MDTNQKYQPDFGYSSPVKTKKECINPAFFDHNLHRVGWFATRFDGDGLPGYIIEKRCVNCGKSFKKRKYGSAFRPSKPIRAIDGRLAGESN